MTGISGIRNLLREQRVDIEQELGYPLDWEELPNRRDSRVSVYLTDVDPEDGGDWARQHMWLAQRLNEMQQVFANRIKVLDKDDWEGGATTISDNRRLGG